MPNVKQHLAKIRSNKNLLNHLGEASSTKYPDWFVTVTFYTALHSIEAIFCQEISLHTNTHFEREKALQKRLPAIDKTFLMAYRALYTQSHQARYMADQKFEITNQDCEDALANLKIIETECKETYFENYPNP